MKTTVPRVLSEDQEPSIQFSKFVIVLLCKHTNPLTCTKLARSVHSSAAGAEAQLFGTAVELVNLQVILEKCVLKYILSLRIYLKPVLNNEMFRARRSGRLRLRTICFVLTSGAAAGSSGFAPKPLNPAALGDPYALRSEL